MNEPLVRNLIGQIDRRPAARAELVAEFQAEAGVTLRTVYRWMNVCGRNGRARRSDRGRTHKDARHLEAVLTLLSACRWDTSALNAIDQAVLAGHIPPGSVTVADVARARAARAVTRADLERPTPHTRMASLYPNHVHQVDASACAQWYLEPAEDGSIRALSRVDEVYINKPPSGKPHLLRYGLTDHTSGAFYCRYYLAAGEREIDLLDFLWRGWATKDQPERYPFCGCPEILVADRGCDRAITRNLMAAMEIEFLPHKPKNPRAKGSIEGWMRWWERTFERLTLLDPPKSLAEMNWRAEQMAAYIQATRRHRRTGATRSAYWAAHIGAVRAVPPRPLYDQLAVAAPVQRVVTGDLAIRWENRLYSLRGVAGVRVGQRVGVVRSAYHDPAVLVRLEAERPPVLVQPVTIGVHGFPADAPVYGERYRAQRTTEMVRAAEAIAAGGKPAIRTDVAAAIAARYELPLQEARFTPGLATAEPRLLPLDARCRAVGLLAERIGREPTQAERQAVAAAIGREGASEGEIETFLAAIAPAGRERGAAAG